MRIVNQAISIDIHMEAISLYSLIAHGHFRALSVGRMKWKSLIGSQASLQPEFNKKGFNARGSSSHSEQALAFQAMKTVTATLGYSRLGFGTVSCGKVARHRADNGDIAIQAMGYILLQ